MSCAIYGAGAQGSWVEQFEPPLTTNGHSSAAKAVLDSSGNIIVTGSTSGIGRDLGLILKYSATGNILWQRCTAAPAKDVAVDWQGNVVVVSYGFHTAKYSAADGTLLWEQNYAGPHNYVEALAVDHGGNVFVTGYSSIEGETSMYYTAKYAAADGTLLWEKRHSNGLAALAVDPNDDLLVTGYFWNGSNTDCYTAKYAGGNGLLLWENLYNGPGDGPDEAKAIALDADGNVLVTGFSYNESDSDYYTAKYAGNDGQLLWEQRYDGSARRDDQATEVLVDASGNVLVTGFSQEDPQVVQHFAKYRGMDGLLLWEKQAPYGAQLALDANDKIYVIGKYTDSGVDYWQLTAYANTGGSLLWEKPCDDFLSFPLRIASIAVNPEGDIVLAGSSKGNSGSELFAARCAADSGTLLWQEHTKGPGYRNAGAIAVTVNKNGEVAVLANAANNGIYDHYVYKYAATNGTLLWSQRFEGQRINTFSWELPLDGGIAFDPNGNVVATGYALSPKGKIRHHTVKYKGTDGTVLWQQNHDGTTSASQGSDAIAIDAGGNVFLAGYALSSSFLDVYFAKYAAQDGTILWEQHCDSSDPDCHALRELRIDSAGNLIGGGTFVGKYSGSNGSLLWERPAFHSSIAVDANDNVIAFAGDEASPGFYNLGKYAGADGAPLWERMFVSYGSSPGSLAVDPAGNVIATGSSYSGSDYSAFVAKHKGEDGALLWERNYNGPGYACLWTRSEAIHSNGDIAVAGCVGDWGNTDYYTARYAGTDGTLLWEKRYDGPVEGNDSVGWSRCLAVAPSGATIVAGRSEGSHDLGDNYMAAIVHYPGGPRLSLTSSGNGYQVSFPATAGLAYRLQRAPSPAGPWSDLGTVNSSSTGRITYTDSSPLPGTAFYRTVTP